MWIGTTRRARTCAESGRERERERERNIAANGSSKGRPASQKHQTGCCVGGLTRKVEEGGDVVGLTGGDHNHITYQ